MRRFGVLIGSLWLLSLTGCLYGFAGGGLPGHIRTVALSTFDNQTPSPEIPKELYAKQGFDAFVHRGQQRFNIYCMPCHDATGSGYGLVRKRAVASGAAAFVPPTFHQDRLRKAPDGQIFATITNGKSNMPPYAMQIQPADRWAIVAYVRALQNANPKLGGIPPEPAPEAADAGTPAPKMMDAPSTDAGGHP